MYCKIISISSHDGVIFRKLNFTTILISLLAFTHFCISIYWKGFKNGCYAAISHFKAFLHFVTNLPFGWDGNSFADLSTEITSSWNWFDCDIAKHSFPVVCFILHRTGGGAKWIKNVLLSQVHATLFLYLTRIGL